MANFDSDIGRIICTDSSCRITGQPWPGIPTLVWQDGIDEPASDWFRALVIDYGVASSSAKEYAKILRPFLRFCRARKRAWNSVDDKFLITWREYMRRSMGVKSTRVNSALKVIFAFYRWAEEKRHIRYRVGIYSQDELPESLRHHTFPISAKKSFTKGRHGRVFGSWTTPLTITNTTVESRVRHTPTEDEIRKLHEIAVERAQGERDSLMLSWAEETGSRRAEFLRICKSQMPTSDAIAELIEKDEPFIVYIKRKGGNTKPINVPIELILRTQDYIEFGRSEIVEHCRKELVGYCEPDEVFLSSKTGLALHPDSITSIGRRTFQRAGIQRANVHRLRARYAVRIIETLVDALFDGQTIGPDSSWIETILIKAAEMMGHADPRSLRPYLTYVLNRRIQTADASKADRVAARLRQLRLHEGTLVRRLGQQRELHAIATHMQAGRNADAAAELRKLAAKLD